MATSKRVFTLRLDDKIFEQIEAIAKNEHRSMTNLIEYALIKYLNDKKGQLYSNIPSKQPPESYIQEIPGNKK